MKYQLNLMILYFLLNLSSFRESSLISNSIEIDKTGKIETSQSNVDIKEECLETTQGLKLCYFLNKVLDGKVKKISRNNISFKASFIFCKKNPCINKPNPIYYDVKDYHGLKKIMGEKEYYRKLNAAYTLKQGKSNLYIRSYKSFSIKENKNYLIHAELLKISTQKDEKNVIIIKEIVDN